MHLLQLAAHSEAVMTVILRLTGHERIGIGLDLATLEAGLEDALRTVRALRTPEE